MVDKLALVSKVLLDRRFLEIKAENERFRVLLRLIKEPPRMDLVFTRFRVEFEDKGVRALMEKMLDMAREFGLVVLEHDGEDDFYNEDISMVCTNLDCHFSMRLGRHWYDANKNAIRCAFGTKIHNARSVDSPDLRKLDDFLWMGNTDSLEYERIAQIDYLYREPNIYKDEA